MISGAAVPAGLVPVHSVKLTRQTFTPSPLTQTRNPPASRRPTEVSRLTRYLRR
jgi:hypothetical protein